MPTLQSACQAISHQRWARHSPSSPNSPSSAAVRQCEPSCVLRVCRQQRVFIAGLHCDCGRHTSGPQQPRAQAGLRRTDTPSTQSGNIKLCPACLHRHMRKWWMPLLLTATSLACWLARFCGTLCSHRERSSPSTSMGVTRDAQSCPDGVALVRLAWYWPATHTGWCCCVVTCKGCAQSCPSVLEVVHTRVQLSRQCNKLVPFLSNPCITDLSYLMPWSGS